MKNFTLNINRCGCLYGLLLGMLFILPGQTCTVSASRSLFSGVTTFVASHPRLSKATGLCALGVGGYLLYKYLHKKRAVPPMPVRPVPAPGDQPGAARNSVPAEQIKIRKADVEAELLRMIDTSEERRIVHSVLYEVAPNLPEELLSLIIDYHQPVLRGRPVHNFGDEAGRPQAFIALSGNRFASGHAHGVIRVWNAKTKQCVQTVQLGTEGTVHSFCLLDDTRLLAAARSDAERAVYVVDLNTSLSVPVNFHEALSSMVTLSANEVLVGLENSPNLWYVNVQTNEVYELQSQLNFGPSAGDSSYVNKVDGKTFVIGIGSERNQGLIGSLTLEVLQRKISEKNNVISAEDFTWIWADDKKPQSMTVLRNKRLVTASSDGSVSILDSGTGALLQTVQGVSGMSFRSIVEFADGTIIVGTDYNLNMLRLDDQGNTDVRRCGCTAPLMLLPEGLVTGDSNGAIRLVQ